MGGSQRSWDSKLTASLCSLYFVCWPLVVSGGPASDTEEASMQMVSSPLLWGCVECSLQISPRLIGLVCEVVVHARFTCSSWAVSFTLWSGTLSLSSSHILFSAVSPLLHGPELNSSGLCETQHTVPPVGLVFPWEVLS